MNINRNNYEEFFLLYADKELAEAEIAEVERFVSSNPDLRIELQMFMDAVLIPEPISIQKSSLYRQESCINLSNFEEFFVLYHDNELSIDQAADTELFVQKHLETQKLFEEIKQARLQPETILFGNKASLYRKEKNVRTIPIFWRAAAAILLLSAGLYGGWSVLKGNKQNDIAVTEPVQSPKKQIPLVIDPQQTDNSKPVVEEKIAAKTPENTGLQGKEEKIYVLKETLKHNEKETNSAAADKLKIEKPAESIAKNQLPVISNQLPVPNSGNEAPLTITGIAANENIEASANLKSNNNEVADVIQASFKDENTNNENYVFYNVSEEKFKKSKVGIFLRKAKRVVTRNTFLSGSKGKIANIDVAPEK